MLKRISRCFGIGVLMFALVACNPGQTKLDELEKLVTEAETEYESYNKEDWQGVEEAYDALLVEMEKYDYSSEEHRKIGKLKGKFEAIQMKYTMVNFSNMVSDYAEEVTGALEGILEELEKTENSAN